MLKHLTLVLLCLVLAMAPVSADAKYQTHGKQQKTEHTLAKKKALKAKSHHTISKKKAVTSKKKATKASLLWAKRKLVREIIRDRKVAIKRASAAHQNTPPALIIGIIATESSNNPNAISSAGAKGLMQTMRIADKATGITCDSFDGDCSINKGTAYWKHISTEYKIYQMSDKLVAYNIGPDAFINKYKGDSDKDSFVRSVKEYMQLAADTLREVPL